MKKPRFKLSTCKCKCSLTLIRSSYSLWLYFFPRSHKLKIKVRKGRSERMTLADFYSTCKRKHFKVSIWKLSRVTKSHRPIAEFPHTLRHYQLYLKKNQKTQQNSRILPNLCLLLQGLKHSCLELSILPLSQEGAFSQQFQELLYCKLWFNLQLRSPAHLQCKLTRQTAFCEARHGHSSALPTVLRGQKHLAEAEQL